MMELFPNELKLSIPGLHTLIDTSPDEMPIAAKFFTPDSSWTWYAVEGSHEGEDFIFFGLVDGVEKEWGYFSLKELSTTKGPMGLSIERDLHFKNKKIKDIR